MKYRVVSSEEVEIQTPITKQSKTAFGKNYNCSILRVLVWLYGLLSLIPASYHIGMYLRDEETPEPVEHGFRCRRY